MNNPSLNADTTSAKRVYQTPELRVVKLRATSIIATSDKPNQTEELKEENKNFIWS